MVCMSGVCVCACGVCKRVCYVYGTCTHTDTRRRCWMSSPTVFYFISLRQVLSRTGSLLEQASKFPGSVFLCSLVLGCRHKQPEFSLGFWGFKHRSSCVHNKCPYLLSHLPISPNCFENPRGHETRGIESYSSICCHCQKVQLSWKTLLDVFSQCFSMRQRELDLHLGSSGWLKNNIFFSSLGLISP